jgi:hypothetical protein
MHQSVTEALQKAGWTPKDQRLLCWTHPLAAGEHSTEAAVRWTLDYYDRTIERLQQRVAILGDQIEGLPVNGVAV